jgi:hypothetical protein
MSLREGVRSMLDRSVLKTFRPLIVTPCFGEKLCLNYVLSIINFQREAMAAGLPFDFFFRPGDSLVTRVRNDCVAYFLSNNAFTHLFWIDADIGFSPEAAFRLLLADRDVAAGVYPLKREDWPAEGVPQGTTRRKFEDLYARYTVNTGRLGETDVDLVIDRDGFMKVREAPTGFMCIKRTVFDELIARYPELKYVPDWPEGSYPEGGVHYRFFDVMVDPESRRYLSEDYGFCRIWEAIGGEIYVDANSNLSHLGERLYRGDFGATLRNASHHAVGAPKGQRIRVSGMENLKPNP